MACGLPLLGSGRAVRKSPDRAVRGSPDPAPESTGGLPSDRAVRGSLSRDMTFDREIPTQV